MAGMIEPGDAGVNVAACNIIQHDSIFLGGEPFTALFDTAA